MFERINLVPRLALAGRIKRRTPWITGFLLIAGCVMVFLMGKTLDGQNQQLKTEIGLLEQRQKNQQEQLLYIRQISAEINELEEKERDLRKIVANLSQVPMQKQRYSELLRNVAGILPATVRCEKIVIEKNGGQISGKATVYRDLPSFVQKLNDMDRFHSVSLNLLNQSADTESEFLAFNIIFGLRPQQ